jgi:hypothetical protein
MRQVIKLLFEIQRKSTGCGCVCEMGDKQKAILFVLSVHKF